MYNCPRCSGPLMSSQGLRCAVCGSAYPEREGVLQLVATPVGGPAYDPHYFATLPQVEHTDDDESMLRSLFRALSPGGILVLTVPAHPSLFDEADVIAGHRRRYRRAELRDKLQRAGFELRALTHFMAPLAFLLAPLRLLVRLFTRDCSALARRDLELRPVPCVNELLLGTLRLEKLLLRATSLPVGTSLIALAFRPETKQRA